MKNVSSDVVSNCLKSVLELSLRKEEREIIVVGDASVKFASFSLGCLVEEVVFVKIPSEGIEAALNFGLRIASGRYVQFMYVTDKLLLEGYGHCMDLLRYKSPEVVMFNLKDHSCRNNVCEDDEVNDGANLLRNNGVDCSPWGYVFERKILSGLHFLEDNNYSYEEFTTLLLLNAEKIISTSAYACLKGERSYEKLDRKDKRSLIKRFDDKFAVICRLSSVSHTMPLEDRLAIERRVAQLTMNYIIDIVKDGRSSNQLKARIDKLEEKGLFPLPVRNYDKRYLLFSKFVRGKLLMSIACKILGH